MVMTVTGILTEETSRSARERHNIRRYVESLRRERVDKITTHNNIFNTIAVALIKAKTTTYI
jgi:hypothetical protein